MKYRAMYIAGLLIASGLHPAAAQDIWMNIQNQYWTNGANWADASAPTNGELVVFNNQSVPADTDLGGNVTLFSLSVTDAVVAVTISNHTLTLLAGGIDLSTAAQDLEIASILNVATAQTWSVQTGRSLIARGRVTGNGVPTKQGAGTLVMRGNDLRTVSTTLAAGETVISGGVFNGTVTLAAGATLIARSGPGLVGEYYPVAPVSNNFDFLTSADAHFATLNPTLLHNFPAVGTNFDFGVTGTNFPPGVPGSNFEGRWLGVFTAPSAGVYTFETASDDGSMLWIDGTNVVFNNFSQAVTLRSGTLGLAAGTHAIDISYFQGAGAYGLYANVAQPGGATNRISLADVQTGPALRSLSADPAATITLDGTFLTLAPTSTLTLATPAGGSGGLRKIGTFGLTLTATNTFSGGLFLHGGTVTVAQAENLGSATGALTIRGGTLRVTGTALVNLDGRALNEETFGGGIDVADAGNALTLTNALRGRGSLTKLGLGVLRLPAEHSISGTVTVAAGALHLIGSGSITNATNLVINGTLAIDDVASLSDAASLRLGVLGGARVIVSNAVSETIGRLYFDGILQASGTWGATGSGAVNINNTIFSGDGVLNVAAGYNGGLVSGSWATNANGNWSDTNNWIGRVYAQGTNSTAYFTNALTADRTVTEDFPAPLPLGHLAFGSPTNSWTVTGGSIELAVSAGSPWVNVATNTATVGTTLVGTQGLAKTGAGRLVVNSATNRYTGTTSVDAGTLQISGAGSLYSGGTITGALVVNSGAALTFDRSNTFGVHTAQPLPLLAINAGGLVQNSSGYYNTLGTVTLGGGELRAVGGSSPQWNAWQVRGTVAVTGVTPSRITGTKSANGNIFVQVGNNESGGATTFEVADVTGNSDADLLVSGGFADSRSLIGTFAAVASTFAKRGPGTALFSGNNLNTGPNLLDAGTIVVSGGVFNGSVALSNGTTLVALEGEGLLGEYYYYTADPLANFDNYEAMGDHLAGRNANLLFNGPATGTNLDFGGTGANFPPTMQNTTVAARWVGTYLAPVPGVYRFETASDDGSMLWIDGTNVVFNNFSQGVATRGGTIGLAAGSHTLVVSFNQGGGPFGMHVNVALPGGATNRMPLASLRTGPAIAGLAGEVGSTVVITNTTLSVVITNNTTFPGTIAGNGVLRKLGTGTWTLTGTNTQTGNVLSGGRLVHNGDVHLGGASSALTFDGGTLDIQNPAVLNLDTHAVNWPTFNGGFDVVNAGSTLTVTSYVGSGSATGNLTKFGPGGLTLTRGATLSRGLFRGGHTELSATEQTAFHFFISLGFGVGERATVAASGLGALISSNDFNIGDTSGSTGIVTATGSAFLRARTLYVGKNGAAVAALHLNGGLLGYAGGGGDWRIGGGNSTIDAQAYGYLRQSGGTSWNDRNFQVGAYGRGVMEVSGGIWTQANGAPVVGRFSGSRGLLHATGGVIEQTGGGAGFIIGEQGYGVLEVDGTAHLALRTGLRVGGVNANIGTGVVNLASGALETTFVGTGPAGSVGTFNFDGGTLRALASSPTFMQGLDAAYVWPGGAVVDAGPNAVTIAQNLLTPPGTGVVSMVLTNGGSGYIGPPLVVIEGGGGTGATAIAQVDLALGVVTGVVVTCPGVDYLAEPVVTLVGGGGTGAGVGVITMGANTGGGFTKLGSGSVKLTGTNTFAGNIIISNGVFLVGSTNLTGGIELAGTNIGIGGAFNVDQSFLTWLAGKMVGSNPAQFAIGANTTNALDLSALPWAGLPIISGGGTESFSGGLTTGSTNLYLGGTIGTLVWARVIGTGTNVFIGWPGGQTSGVVTLSGTNVGYGSEINVMSGSLRPGMSNGLGGAAARVIVSDGAALDLSGQYAGDMPVYVVGRGPHGNGVIFNAGAIVAPALRTVHLTGDATFGGPSRWDIRASSAGPLLNLAGFTATKTNGNEVTFFNCEVTDGNVNVDQGLIRIEQGSVVTAGVGRITVGPAGTLDFYNLTGLCMRAITVSGGYLSAVGVNFVGSPITLAGPTNTFEPYVGASLVLTGVVDGVGPLRKQQPGTLRLLRTEAYAGDTLVNGGLLSLEASDAAQGTIGSSASLTINNGGIVRVTTNDGLFGAQARPVTIRAGGLLTITDAAARLVAPLTLTGGTLDGSAPHATRGNWKLEAVVNVLSNAGIIAARVQLGVATGTVFDVATGQILVASTTFEDPELGAGGTGTLVKAGAGMLAVLSTNRYSGPTRVLAGALRLGAYAPPPGSQLWLDAADVATLTADGSAKVSAWNDKSGQVRHATQTNAASQPTLVTNAIPNRPVLRFAGGVEQLDVNLAFLANSSYTILGVEARTNNGNVYFLGTRSGTVNNGLHFGYRNNTAFTLAQYSNDLDTGVPGYTGPLFRVWNGTLDTAYGHSLYVNGTNVSNNANTTPFTASIGPGVVGAGYSGGNFLGDVGEIIVYNRPLSVADRKVAEAYLMNKWLGGVVLADLLPAASPLQIAAGAWVDLGGVRQTVGTLSDLAGTGGLVLNNAVGAAVLVVGQAGVDAAFSGVIQDGTGSVAVIKVGVGAQTLHGLNTFGGGTTISNGALLVSGVIGTGAVTVVGGTLGGTGVALGAVSSAGTVSPGPGPGRFTISNSYQQTGTLLIELAGTTAGSGYDVLAVSGAASLGGTLTVVTNGGFAPASAHTFTILTAGGGATGSFAATNLPPMPTGLGWEVTYPGAAVVLTVTGSLYAPTAYELWAQSITNPALRGEQEDPDGDGYANLFEYSQGSDATNAADNAKLHLARTNGQFLAAFNRVNTATDIVYEVEGAYAPTNGALWLGVATNAIGSWGSSTNVNDNDTATIHRVWVTDLELGTNRTLRLKVTRP